MATGGFNEFWNTGLPCSKISQMIWLSYFNIPFFNFFSYADLLPMAKIYVAFITHNNIAGILEDSICIQEQYFIGT